MKFAALIFAQLARKKTRMVFTMLSIAVAFLMLGLLSAIDSAFNRGVELAGLDRLITVHKYSIIQQLPISYRRQINAIDGVVDAATATWFGGYYKEPSNFFPKFPVEPESYLAMYPELQLPQEQLETWQKTRTGAIAGRSLANRFNWKIGDRIPIQADIWPQANGVRVWEFDLCGIYDGATEVTDTSQFLFRYDYFDESRSFGKGQSGWYVVRVKNPDDSARIAKEIDALFANSAAETKTSSEEEFNKGFAKQMGDIGAIIRGILGAVFFTILLVVGNTITQSIRERSHEIAVLKTIGYSDMLICTFVLAETLFLILIPALAGMLISSAMLGQMSVALQNFLPYLAIPASSWLLAAGITLGLAIITGLPPALYAMKLKIIDALAEV